MWLLRLCVRRKYPCASQIKFIYSGWVRTRLYELKFPFGKRRIENISISLVHSKLKCCRSGVVKFSGELPDEPGLSSGSIFFYLLGSWHHSMVEGLLQHLGWSEFSSETELIGYKGDLLSGIGWGMRLWSWEVLWSAVCNLETQRSWWCILVGAFRAENQGCWWHKFILRGSMSQPKQLGRTKETNSFCFSLLVLCRRLAD